MKYMITIYGNQELWESFSAEEFQKAIAEQEAFNRKFKETGELLGAYGNADAAQAKTVRVRNGAPAVTDGPYLEAKEYLASWYLIDVESEQRALDIAAELPFASFNAVEVWPILHEATGNEI
ncbi:YciI family protein [Micromonospora zhanjiangensis]|uniref:YciI family protein n=1 Tax=Micromonospora zhanjiangensis TaxID=1522057 RepID=A0ABV8KRP8_9ACTN